MKKLLTSLAAVGALATAAHAAPAEHRKLGVEASIPFASSVGVRNFRAVDNDTLYIQDNRRRWYRADLMGYCPDLRFAHSIGIVTRGTSTLDRFGQILVRGHSCQITSLVTAAAPDQKRLPRENTQRAERSGPRPG